MGYELSILPLLPKDEFRVRIRMTGPGYEGPPVIRILTRKQYERFSRRRGLDGKPIDPLTALCDVLSPAWESDKK